MSDEFNTEDGKRGLLVRRALAVAIPVGVLVGGGALFSVMMATGPKPEKKEDAIKPVAVQIAKVEQAAARVSVTVQGEVRPRTKAQLAAQAAGRVVWTSPAFVDGGAFRQGEVLMRIDDADYKLAVVRARAQVAQSKEALAREEAEGDLARQDWEVLGQGRQASSLTLREPQLAQAKAALAAAEAQLKSAELDLARTAVTAPFTGRLNQRRVAVGDYVGPGTPVAEAFATDVMEVRIPLTDADLAALETPIGFVAGATRPGPAAHLSAVVAGKERKWEGRLVRTEASVDARTRLVYGVLEVREPFSTKAGAPLAPGLFVSASLDGATEESFLKTPRSALKRNEFVYVVAADDTIDIRNLRAAQTTSDYAFFRNGLKAGERVVTSTLPSPRQGMKVTPIDERAQAAALQKSTLR